MIHLSPKECVIKNPEVESYASQSQSKLKYREVSWSQNSSTLRGGDLDNC